MNDVPLIQKADINSINTSIIAIKKQLKQLTEAVGLIDIPDMPDLSPFVKKTDVADVVEADNMNPVTSNAVAEYTVDEVTSGNMHSVSSNAVASTFNNYIKVYSWEVNNSVTLAAKAYTELDIPTSSIPFTVSGYTFGFATGYTTKQDALLFSVHPKFNVSQWRVTIFNAAGVSQQILNGTVKVGFIKNF